MDAYRIKNIELLDSPSLIVFKDRVLANIQEALKIAGEVNRFRPHVKTHKLGEIIQLHTSLGVKKFKCATLAEMEMVAMNGGEDILLAHQPVGPKIEKLISLIKQFPGVSFSVLVDDYHIVNQIAERARANVLEVGIWVDVDNGMHRSGIEVGEAAAQLIRHILDMPGVLFEGLHVYDGHIRDTPIQVRKHRSDEAFTLVEEFITRLKDVHIQVPRIIAGGSPTFSIHAQREGVELSPGTYVFWDFGYQDMLPDYPFECAAILLTRVISKPGKDLLCLDAGHKAIASENPHPRIRLLNIEIEAFVGHSEEHLVIRSKEAETFMVGDILLGIPRHICPTVALQHEVFVVEGQEVREKWEVSARKRSIIGI
ncbi:MAG: D-TA family PLP-dependent enzyme [Bacteroidota bacterium]